MSARYTASDLQLKAAQVMMARLMKDARYDTLLVALQIRTGLPEGLIVTYIKRLAGGSAR